jgi:hypothetical protein
MVKHAREGCDRLPHGPSIAIPRSLWKRWWKILGNELVWSGTRSPDGRETQVEDREEKTGSDPELEAHRKKRLLKASDEASAEAPEEEKGEDKGDVELHRKTKLTK